MICDNKSQCHDLGTIAEDKNAVRMVCNICHKQYVIRKEPFKDVPLNRQYIKLAKRYSLQGGDNLFYKYYPQYLQH